jgi:hypothetical protein
MGFFTGFLEMLAQKMLINLGSLRLTLKYSMPARFISPYYHNIIKLLIFYLPQK